MMPASDQAGALLSSPVVAGCGSVTIDHGLLLAGPVVNIAHYSTFIWHRTAPASGSA
jgi:hypothetical protein